MNKYLGAVAAGVLMLGMANSSEAVIIDFSGGTAYLEGGGTAVTNHSSLYSNVDYYIENGFKLDFIGGSGYIGTYYGGDNDVIHGHWGTGWYGTLTEIKVSRVDNATFDLNYFELTSNTDTGGGPASGNELAYIKGYNADGTLAGSRLLPPSIVLLPHQRRHLHGPRRCKVFQKVSVGAFYSFSTSFHLSRRNPFKIRALLNGTRVAISPPSHI